MIEMQKESSDSFLICIHNIIENEILPFYIKEIDKEVDMMAPAVHNVSHYVEILQPFQFTQADIATSINNNTKADGDYSKSSRRIMSELIMLQNENTIPMYEVSSIFTCCDINKIQFMKFLITGPSDTPYDSGCYVFEAKFPPSYPSVPPSIRFISGGGVRFNPNLYDSGYICLSILGTYSGPPLFKSEKWNENTSTIIQVMISIQSQILSSEPYYNEPGRDSLRGTKNGNDQVDAYNKTIHMYNMQHAILDFLENPKKYPEFEDIIRIHFKLRREYIINMMNSWESETKDLSFKNLKYKIIEKLNELEES